MTSSGRNITQYFPFLMALVVQPFIHSELSYTLLLVLLVAATFLLHHERKEWLLFTIGAVFGFAFEALGGLVYRLQYWENASLLGIPVWLPLLWGYGFVMIRRFGNDFLAKAS